MKSRPEVEAGWRAFADAYCHVTNLPRDKVRDIFAKEMDWYLKNRTVGEREAIIRFNKLQDTIQHTVSNRLEFDTRADFLEWLLS